MPGRRPPRALVGERHAHALGVRVDQGGQELTLDARGQLAHALRRARPPALGGREYNEVEGKWW